MALDHLQFLRGSDSDNDGYTGLDGEITIDKSNNGLRIHDGSEQGGYTVVPERMQRVADVTELKNTRPTPDRFVVVDGKTSQFDGFGGLAVWDDNGDASNANGTELISSNVSGFQAGDPDEGVWVVILGLVEELKDFGQATFDGDGSTNTFTVPHNINVTPESWRVTPVTDDASGFSHATADNNEVTFEYDYAPPSGSNNVVLNWVVEREGIITSLTASYGTAVFDGDGIRTEFCIPHEVTGKPAVWQVEALTNEGSGISHVTADQVNLCVQYDSPPPPGSNNVVFNWYADPGTFQGTALEDAGRQTASGDGLTTSFDIPHNLGEVPEFAVVTAVSDDASGIQELNFDSSKITVNYSSPPPAGSDNLEISWFASETEYSGSGSESGGKVTFNGDGTSTQFSFGHGLSSTPENAVVTENNPDAAGISHISYDASVINVFYDTPPADNTNVQINWYALI